MWGVPKLNKVNVLWAGGRLDDEHYRYGGLIRRSLNNRGSYRVPKSNSDMVITSRILRCLQKYVYKAEPKHLEKHIWAKFPLNFVDLIIFLQCLPTFLAWCLHQIPQWFQKLIMGWNNPPIMSTVMQPLSPVDFIVFSAVYSDVLGLVRSSDTSMVSEAQCRHCVSYWMWHTFPLLCTDPQSASVCIFHPGNITVK